MRIAQVQSASPEQPKAAALPFQFQPLALDPEVRARLLEALSRSTDLSKVNGAVEKAPPATASPTRVKLDPAAALGLPPGLYPGTPFMDWTKPLLLPRKSIDDAAVSSVAIPTALPSMGFVKPPAALNIGGAIQLMPGLSVRPLPSSRAKLERIGQVATWGQIAVEPFGEAGIHSPVLEGFGTGFDLLAAGVAVAELVEQVADPKPMPRWKKITFVLKRVLAIITGASHFVGGGTEYMRVVGIVVKICDRGTDQYYAYKIEPPEPPSKAPTLPPRGPASRT